MWSCSNLSFPCKCQSPWNFTLKGRFYSWILTFWERKVPLTGNKRAIHLQVWVIWSSQPWWEEWRACSGGTNWKSSSLIPPRKFQGCSLNKCCVQRTLGHGGHGFQFKHYQTGSGVTLSTTFLSLFPYLPGIATLFPSFAVVLFMGFPQGWGRSQE